MGYVARYRKEAQEKALPNWQHFYIAEIEKTSEAIIAYRNPHGYWKDGKWAVTYNPYPEFPMTLPSYEEAFAYLSRKLIMRDVAEREMME
jgi:hypothetical protein